MVWQIFFYVLFLFLTITNNCFAQKQSLELKADKVIYQRDKKHLQALGHVEVFYKNYYLRSDELHYHQEEKELIALGNVFFKENQSDHIYADKLRLTDKFTDGFAKNLRIITKYRGQFSAREATQESNKQQIQLNEASYTACKICQTHPVPSWRIVGKKIIWDQKKREVYFNNTRFLFFDVPILWLPYFQIADPTVKRKTGFLKPSLVSNSYIGQGLKIPFFFNLAPSYDLTFTGGIFSKQGFLSQAKWRQKLNKGSYNLELAHIQQKAPNIFPLGTIDRLKTERTLLNSTGLFRLADAWQIGWRAFLQSDKNFGRTYNIQGVNQPEEESILFLTGLKDDNYFDLSLSHFTIQESLLDSSPLSLAQKEPFILPHFNYERREKKALFGGVLDSDVYFSSLYFINHSSKASEQAFMPSWANYGRIDLNWQKRNLLKNGMVFLPSLSFNFRHHSQQNNTSFRKSLSFLPSFGAELNYPLFIETNQNYHLVEPVAQLYISGNEEATLFEMDNFFQKQPMFTAANLFQKNRFLSPNRLESGTRLNAGLRYYKPLKKGWMMHSVIGQSLHLLGKNSFHNANMKTNSLPAWQWNPNFSDIVALVQFSNQDAFFFSFDGNLGQTKPILNRAEFNLGKSWERFSFNLFYNYHHNNLFINKNSPNSYKVQQEIGGQQNWQISDHWRIGLYNRYDISSTTLTNSASWLGYNDECLDITLGYRQTRSPGVAKPAHKFEFSIALRTVGGFNKFSQE